MANQSYRIVHSKLSILACLEHCHLAVHNSDVLLQWSFRNSYSVQRLNELLLICAADSKAGPNEQGGVRSFQHACIRDPDLHVLELIDH